MDFGAIISFIAIALISSLFNKDKKTTKPTRTPVQPNRSNAPSRSATQLPKATKYNKRTFTGGLEDLFKDLRTEFEKNFSHNETNQYNYTSTEKAEEIVNMESDYTKRDAKKIDSDSNYYIDENSVYAGEIGSEEVPIEFNRKSIIQGIIMSEILQKPKSLRR